MSLPYILADQANNEIIGLEERGGLTGDHESSQLSTINLSDLESTLLVWEELVRSVGNEVPKRPWEVKSLYTGWDQ